MSVALAEELIRKGGLTGTMHCNKREMAQEFFPHSKRKSIQEFWVH
jgi:hypothetical protein